MIDAKGCILAAPNRSGLCGVVRRGFVDPSYYAHLPGFSVANRKAHFPSNVVDWTNGAGARPRATPSGLQLRQYQCVAVAQIKAAHRGFVLSLDIGLGKSCVALQVIHELDLFPFVVVGPLMAYSTWCNGDPQKHYNWDVLALRGKPADNNLTAGAKGPHPHGYFLNYEILDDWALLLRTDVRPKAVVFDESHILRNARTKARKAAAALRAYTQKTILLTATPIVNHVGDLWSQLDLAQPRQWSWWIPFNVRYRSAHRGEYGWQYGDESNSAELAERLKGVLLRQSRFDVRKELPEFQRVAVEVPEEALDQDKLRAYQEVQTDIATVLRAEGKSLQGAALQRSTRMLQLLSEAKWPAALEEARGLLTPSRKIVIFSWFKGTTQWLAKKLKKDGVAVFGPVTAQTSLARRQKLADDLVNAQDLPKGAAFIATLGTAGMALNQLACCDVSLFVDLWWVPMVLLQAEGRTHREGQKASRVVARYLTVRKSADDIMLKHLERKARAVVSAIADGEAQSLTECLGGPDAEGSSKLNDLLEELAQITGAEL